MGAYSAAYSSGYDIGETPTPSERVFSTIPEDREWTPLIDDRNFCVEATLMAACDFGAPKVKDPDAVLDFRFDWSAWLADGEDIVEHEIIADGLTVDSSGSDGQAVTVWTSGGEANTVARITCRITTNNVPARTDDRTGTIRIRER